MADDNFGGMTQKGNLAWVPSTLSALARWCWRDLAPSIPIRKLLIFARNLFGASPKPHRIRFMADVNSKRCRRARLTVVHPRAAGIDIGCRFHVVAEPSELDDEPVRVYVQGS